MKEKQDTIMVVDNTPANLKLLQDMLQSKGYRVLASPNGKMALHAATKSQPDLILLDIDMPEMDGFEVCRRLKANEATKDIPVLFISALTETADKVKAFAVGGVDYVSKPFQFEEVSARVETHLELRRQKRELQQSYNKLRELETQRDGLVHMIVHDLRSPLAVVLGNLEMAQADTLPENAAFSVSAALSSTEMVIEMVSAILDISKMEAGQMTLDYSVVDMSNLVRETMRMVAPLQSHRSLTLTPPGEQEALSCDANLIRRILQNLIVNAIKFTDKQKGVITISMEKASANTVRVSVADNGPGVPPEYCEKVFDKFYQVSARKQGQGRSTGLGLTFCKLAVEAHGGRIGLESDEGKGSTFWFELPLRKRENVHK